MVAQMVETLVGQTVESKVEKKVGLTAAYLAEKMAVLMVEKLVD